MENKNKKTSHFLLIDLLQSLTERELNNLTEFVACRYFNTDSRIRTLLEGLKKILRKKEFDETAQMAVYQQVHPEKKLTNQALNAQQKRLLLSEMNTLTRLTELFLSVEGLQQNAACKTELLYEKLLEKNQFSLFNRHRKKDEKQLAKQTERGIDYYAQWFRIENSTLDYLHKDELVFKEDNISELNDSLDIYYLLNKLRLQQTALSSVSIDGKKTYDFSLMQQTIAPLLELPQYANHPLVSISYVATQLLPNSDLETYHSMLKLLDEHAVSIPKDSLIDFYVIASNFCVSQIIAGNTAFYVHLYDIYVIMDEKDLLKERGIMPFSKLKNIVSISCRLNEFEWANTMIEKYRSAIKKEYRDSVYHFNMGAIAFYQNDYKTAIQHFIRVGKINAAYDIDSRIILLKSHYQLDKEYDERTMQIFRREERFVQNNKDITTKSKKAYKNFIRTLINLYRIRYHATKMSVESLKDKLEKQGVNSDKRWLTDRIKELKK